MNNKFTILYPELFHIIDEKTISPCRMDYATTTITGVKYYCYICKRYAIVDKNHYEIDRNE